MSIRAAQYVRMSTEHQQYSTENQADVLREYAAKRGMDAFRFDNLDYFLGMAEHAEVAA